MAEDRIERRLAAILAADVVGYSRLMGVNEAGTRAAFNGLLDGAVRPAMDRHRGRLVKTMGDGFLSEFASVVDAVQGAVDIQQAAVEQQHGTGADTRMRLRIGIHLGDVIVEGDDIHGDGVNIAARLEGLAEPGGICVSDMVRAGVGRRLELDFADMGEKSLKNIAEPVKVYAVRPSVSPEKIGEAPLALPDKPSIAVLPFDNMSGDPEQEYFSDGIAEDLITTLSRFHWFFVIARNSSFTYKGKAVNVTRVARELGVQYVLEGSVRKGGDRVRISAQLIDALTGRHIWAERYDRNLDDIFAVQDEITEAIATAVAPSFVSAEARRVQRKSPESFDAWDHVMRGNWHLWRLHRDDMTAARRCFGEAVQRNPTSAIAHSGLATACIIDSFYGWSSEPEATRELARRSAMRAIELDEGDAAAHCALAMVAFWTKHHDAAVTACERALALNPNLALAEAILGGVYSWTGDYDDCILHTEIAERLSPRDPAHSMWGINRATAEFCAGRYDRSAELAKKAIQATPNHPSSWRMLAASLAHLGREDEARKAVKELIGLLPGLTIERCRQTIPIKQSIHLEPYLEGLRKAGLPE